MYLVKIGSAYVAGMGSVDGSYTTSAQADAQRFDTVEAADAAVASLKVRRVKLNPAGTAARRAQFEDVSPF